MMKWCEPCTSPIWCRAHGTCDEITDEIPPKPVTAATAFDALWVYISEWWWPGVKSRLSCWVDETDKDRWL